MNLLDWSIVVIPIILLGCVAIYSHKYTRSIADYLACGRVAGRYIISVGDIYGGRIVCHHTGCGSGTTLSGGVFCWILVCACLTGVNVYRAFRFFCLSLAANPLSVFRAVS